MAEQSIVHGIPEFHVWALNTGSSFLSVWLQLLVDGKLHADMELLKMQAFRAQYFQWFLRNIRLWNTAQSSTLIKINLVRVIYLTDQLSRNKRLCNKNELNLTLVLNYDTNRGLVFIASSQLPSVFFIHGKGLLAIVNAKKLDYTHSASAFPCSQWDKFILVSQTSRRFDEIWEEINFETKLLQDSLYKKGFTPLKG